MILSARILRKGTRAGWTVRSFSAHCPGTRTRASSRLGWQREWWRPERSQDGLLIAGAVADDALKARLLQNNRSVVAKLVKIQKAMLVAAKEGMGFAQKLFVPDPTYDELDDDELKLMEKLRKEKAANKKKANIVPF